MDIKGHQEEIKKLEDHIASLIKINDKALSNLAPEEYEKIKVYHEDTHKILRGLKKGDLTGLEDLMKKYS